MMFFFANIDQSCFFADFDQSCFFGQDIFRSMLVGVFCPTSAKAIFRAMSIKAIFLAMPARVTDASKK